MKPRGRAAAGPAPPAAAGGAQTRSHHQFSTPLPHQLSAEPPSPSGPAAATRSRTAGALAARTGAGASVPLTQAQADALAGRGLGEHGCKHYRRRARLVAPCCGEVFWCRHCHNEAKAANEWVSVRGKEVVVIS